MQRESKTKYMASSIFVLFINECSRRFSVSLSKTVTVTRRLFAGGQDSPVLLLRVERSKRDVGAAGKRGS